MNGWMIILVLLLWLAGGLWTTWMFGGYCRLGGNTERTS
jgi:hypothetical protein